MAGINEMNEVISHSYIYHYFVKLLSRKKCFTVSIWANFYFLYEPRSDHYSHLNVNLVILSFMGPLCIRHSAWNGLPLTFKLVHMKSYTVCLWGPSHPHLSSKQTTRLKSRALRYVTNVVVKKWPGNTLMSYYGMLNKLWSVDPNRYKI